MSKDFSVILLAAGRGQRMNSDEKKQFMSIMGRPMIYYPLKTFCESAAANIIIVTSRGDVDYVKNEIVDRYGFDKVSDIVEGGGERYLSVYEGLKCVSTRYVLVHDGARCAIRGDVIDRTMKAAMQYRAAEAAVPAVDTIKLADREGFVSFTPNRSDVWQIQTPQGFETELLKAAYRMLLQRGDDAFDGITDDAMVVERAFPGQRIRLVEGDISNTKVTVRRDLVHMEKTLCEMGFTKGDSV